jgi:hypothetical protein
MDPDRWVISSRTLSTMVSASSGCGAVVVA